MGVTFLIDDLIFDSLSQQQIPLLINLAILFDVHCHLIVDLLERNLFFHDCSPGNRISPCRSQFSNHFCFDLLELSFLKEPFVLSQFISVERNLVALGLL
jgi:hypothetical protein